WPEAIWAGMVAGPGIVAAPYTLSSVEGESAIIVPIAVPATISRLRERMDPSAAAGVPAHVTLLYPFMPVDGLTDEVRRTIGRFVAAEPDSRFSFPGAAHFPNVFSLPPEPAEQFRRMTAAIAAQFPDFPPYEGAYEMVVPHLTVAQDVPADFYAAAEHALPP